MRHPHTTRSDDLRQPAWAQWIADVLGLADYSDRLPRTALARCLLMAAALGLAVSAVARRVSGGGREVVRRGIRATLPDDPRDLERRLAAGLRQRLPRALRRHSVPVAIDVHRRPYYGDHDRTRGVTGGQAERGTHYFWSYATAVSLVAGQRHTLALTAIGPRDTPAVLVERLLARSAGPGSGSGTCCWTGPSTRWAWSAPSGDGGCGSSCRWSAAAGRLSGSSAGGHGGGSTTPCVRTGPGRACGCGWPW